MFSSCSDTKPLSKEEVKKMLHPQNVCLSEGAVHILLMQCPQMPFLLFYHYNFVDIFGGYYGE
jgi:hypothetical protein